MTSIETPACPRPFGLARSFAGIYVEFATANIKLALYRRRALAKDAGVSLERSGSNRLVIASDMHTFTGPDGFRWQAAGARGGLLTASAIPQTARPGARP